MKRSVLSASAASAMVTRIFYGLMLDDPHVHNGAWLSVLIGAVLALPVLALLGHAYAAAGRRAPALRVILGMLLTLDAASAIDCAAASASFLAFTHVPERLLMLPLLAAALRTTWLGRDAVDNAALLLVRTAPVALLIAVLYQLPYYRPVWLAPVLGFGLPSIAKAGLRTAGWMTLTGGAVLFGGSDRGCPLRTVLAAVPVLVLLIALRLMMSPALDDAGMQRGIQLDALLSNGRAPLYCQLPMLLLWFMGLMDLIAFECATVGGMIGGSRRSIGLIGPAAAALLALAGAPRVAQQSSLWTFGIIVAAAVMALILSRKGDVTTCAR